VSTHSPSTAAQSRRAALPRKRLVRGILELDAAVTGANGLVYLAAAGALDSPLGVPAGLLRSLGLFLIVFAAILWFLATRPHVSRAVVYGVAAGNVAWTLGSIVFVVADVYSPSTAGAVWIVLQAVVVAVFAGVQLVVAGDAS
jgi:hypothetical protein